MQKGKKMSKALLYIVIAVLLVVLALGVVMTSQLSAKAWTVATSDDGKYYSTFDTYNEARAAAAEVNAEVTAEGNVLLKNDGALPLKGKTVSIFGRAQNAMTGVSTSALAGTPVTNLSKAFADEGFTINASLANHYAAAGNGTIGTENRNFPGGVENSFAYYNDLAVIIIARTGGEGSDPLRAIDGQYEDEKGVGIYANGYGWEHDALPVGAWGFIPQSATNGSISYVQGFVHEDQPWEPDVWIANTTGNNQTIAQSLPKTRPESKTYKHYFQLTDTEEELVNYVKQQNFKNILFVVNSTSTMELANLENDPQINSILWVGRPGATGAKAIPQIVSGKVNPSGKTPDIYYKDFTLDPVWYNFANNTQVGQFNSILVDAGTTQNPNATASTAFFQVEYNEDIYLGYKFAETAHYEAGEGNYSGFDYNDYIMYPFGYGLSYTAFAYDNMSIVTDKDDTWSANDILDADDFASEVNSPANIKKIYVSVDVTNTGETAGKEAVQIYVTAPYNSTDARVEKSHVTLVGFAKSGIIQPGKTETVTVEVNVQDMASYDWRGWGNASGEKGYVLEGGDWIIRAMGNSHSWADPSADDYADFAFEIDEDAYLHLDDFTDNEVSNLFSPENDEFYSLRDNTNGVRFNKDTSAANDQKLMTRSNFKNTFPKATTLAARTITKEVYDYLLFYNTYSVDNYTQAAGGTPETGVQTDIVYTAVNTDILDDSSMPWVREAKEYKDAGYADDWTQKANGEATYPYKLSEMSGIDPLDRVTIIDDENSPFDGKTHVEAWEMFLNELTYADLKDVFGRYQKQAFPAIDYKQLSAVDRTNQGGQHEWQCNAVLAATWNQELSLKQGIAMGNMMLLNGTNVYWGTNMNTHRSPFSGRNSEYFSEDGILGGYMGAYQTYGVSSCGIAAYTKHSSLNDQETNRNGMNILTWVSEQAARETYHRQFQMAVQEGGATGVMGAFARAGRISINVNYNFCTELYRNEWGFYGSITTDMYAGMRSATHQDMLVRAGTDSIDSNQPSGTWDAAKGAVMVGKRAGAAGTDGIRADVMRESFEQWYFVRKAATWVLWTHANSAMNKNGVSFLNWTGTNALGSLKQGAAATAGFTVQNPDGHGVQKVAYTVTSGELPDGLTLNASTGALTGTVTASAGNYSFTVQYLGDNWVKATRTFNIDITSGFTTTGTALNAAVTGTAFVGTIAFEGGANSYTVASGALPTGITLASNGQLSGTPSAAGTYSFTVSATVGSGSSAKAYSQSYEMVVSGAATAPGGAVVSAAINANKELVVTYENGYVVNLGSVVGPAGTPGTNGTNGADGATILMGTTAPAATEGKDGDLYLNTGTFELYEKDGSTWTKVGTLKGADGTNGTNGTNGSDGKDAEGGCGSTIAVSSIAVILGIIAGVAAIILFVRKKKEN